jgi:amino acid adenylation domain-containing protein/non-ribosomal peptide synthase protein (TIGR01720 family)
MNLGLPLTAAQHGVWVAQQLAPESPMFTCGVYFDIPGPVDGGLLTEAVRRAVAETGALRVRFVSDGETATQILDAGVEGALTVVDLAGEADPEAAARAWLDADQAAPVAVTGGPLFAHVLLRLGDRRNWLYFRYHHLLLDGYAQVLYCTRLLESYTALVAHETPGASPFGLLRDVLTEEVSYAESKRHGRDSAYWLGEFADRPASTELGSGTTGLSQSLPGVSGLVSTKDAQALRELSGARWSLPVIAAMAAYTHRMTSANDVLIRVFLAARMSPAALGTPAMLVNELPLRLRVEPSTTFADLVAQVARRMGEATRHQRFPGDQLRREASMAANTNAVSGPSVNVLSFASTRIMAGATEAVVHQLSAGPVRDLALNAYADSEATDGIQLTFNAHPGRFTTGDVELHRDRFSRLLTAAAAEPARPIGTVDLLGEDDWNLFERWNDTASTVDSRSLVELFEAQDPAAEAVAFEGTRVTYGELNARANKLARALVNRGVEVESRVAVMLPRSVELVVALWAVLKAGAAFVPVETGYPAERIAYILADSGASFVLSDVDSVNDVGDESAANPGVCVAGDNAAYVIYTSGSTGKPKGTVVTRAGIANMLAWMQDEYRLTPADRVVQKTPIGFDVSVWEFFWTLTRGATLVVARPEGHRDPAYLARLVRDEHVTVIHFVPALLGPFLDEYLPAPSLRMVSCGGEALPPGLAARFHRECGAALHNSYGPTEFSVTATSWAWEPADVIPIGVPTHNTRAYVLDAALSPAAPGAVGELYLAGIQLARGYLDRPGLTAHRFVADPYAAGTRMYRTGDLVRRRADGNLEFAGRVDTQVKINGQRVELGEIEAALAGAPGVEQSVVLVRETATGARQLLGYVTGTPETGLRDWLAARLPAYLVPSAVLTLASIPLTPNGKLDRHALPAPAEPATGRAPRTETESVLCGLAAELLGTPALGIDDDFFLLGADSIVAIQLTSRARRAGIRLTPQNVFDHPTIAKLAAVAEVVPEAAVVDDDPVGDFPETPIMRWLSERPGPTGGFAQSMLLRTDPGLRVEHLVTALQTVLDRHDALRLRAGGIQPAGAVRADGCLRVIDGTDFAGQTESARRRLAPRDGVTVQAVWFPDADRLLLVVHHLVVDGVSWRIILPDLAEALVAQAEGREPVLSPVGTSLRRWSRSLAAKAAELDHEIPLWTEILSTVEPVLGARALDPATDVERTSRSVTVAVPAGLTETLLTTLPVAYRATADDVLLAALARAVQAYRGPGPVLVDLEGHGRDALAEDLDVTATVGWFTSLYPVRLDPGTQLLKDTKENLRRIPGNGIGHGLLRPRLTGLPTPQIGFNYLGRIDANSLGGWELAPEMSTLAALADDELSFAHSIEINAYVRDGVLSAVWSFPAGLFGEDDVRRLADLWLTALHELAQDTEGGLTPSDVPLVHIGQNELDGFPGAQDVLPVSPLQEGLLFLALYETDDPYVGQLVLDIDGGFEPAVMRTAATALLHRHPNLRAGFHTRADAPPVQVVPAGIVTHWDERTGDLESFLAEDRVRGFDVGRPPLLRFTALGHRLVLTHHHLLLDGWSLPLLVEELFALYGGVDAPPPVPYRAYLAWLGRQDRELTVAAWRTRLDGLAGPTLLAPAGRIADGRGEHELVLSEALTGRLTAAARSRGLTVNTVVQGLWGLLLHGFTGRDDVVFGATVSGRPPELPGVESIIGLFINTLPVRVRPDDTEPLATLLSRVQDQQAGLGAHHHIGLADVTRATGLDELFDTVVAYENYPMSGGLAAGGLRLASAELAESTHYPMTLSVFPGAALRLRMSYLTGVFGPDAAETLAGGFLTLFESAAAGLDRPTGELPRVTGEQRLLVTGRTDSGSDPGTTGIRAHFAALSTGRAPRTPEEELLCGLFADVLGLERVTIDDEFFDLGGTSILVTRLTHRLRDAFGVDLPLRDVFATPTVAGLAERLAELAPKPAGLAVTAERPARIPLSFAQERLWFLQRLEGASGTYNIPLVLRLTGDLDGTALRHALGDLVTRHEALRTIFPEDAEGPHQVVLPAGTVMDLTVVRSAEPDLAAVAVEPFDPATEIPVRATLFDVGPAEHVLVLVVHHIASDGASLVPLARDLSVAYTARLAGNAPVMAPLKAQYPDFAVWQRTTLDAELSRQVGYWTGALGGLPNEVTLPADRHRPATATHRGDQIDFTVEQPLYERVLALAGRTRTTPFMVLQAAVAVLMTAMGAGEDIPLGGVLADRADPVLDDTVGVFINTLVYRVDTAGDPRFSELLTRVRETGLAAYAHQDVPFERLVEELNPERSPSRHPFFQVMVAVQDLTEARIELPGLAAVPETVTSGTAKFDLLFDFYTATGAGLKGSLEYATDLYDRATVLGFSERLVQVLTLVTKRPSVRLSEVDVFRSGERDLVLDAWNDTESPRADELVHETFAAQAVRTPDDIAVVASGRSLTYAELDAWSNRLSHWMIERGAGPERVVALKTGRSLDYVVGLLATLKSGAAVLALDDVMPAERAALVLGEARPVLEFTGAGVDLGDCPSTAPDVAVSRHNAAYVIYTSGSSGRPKGVVVEHGSAANLFADHQASMWGPAAARAGRRPRIGLTAALTFDSSWTGILVMFGGYELHLIDEWTRRDADALVSYVDTQGIDMLDITPSLLDQLVTAGLFDPSRHRPSLLAVGGEALGDTLWTTLRALPGVTAFNTYGPTEATVDTVVVPLADSENPVIGRPMANTRVYVLDNRLHPVPPGVPGELYLAGAQLARGYLGRGELTAERFVADPYGPAGTRMYRTGDIVRWTAAGVLDYLGRADDQVKLRGFRVELGEVEHALARFPGVVRAAAAVHGQRLTGYVVTSAPVDHDELNDHLAATLPDYMVPAPVMELDALPLTPHGKLDRKALPVPEFAPTTGRAPRTPQEEILCGLFAQVLGVAEVSLDDDFFALGGHSLLATRLASRIRSVLGVEVELRTLFEATTVARLSPRLAAAGPRRASVVAQPRAARVPLSYGQERLWFLHRFEGPSATYNVPIALRFSGDLDVDALVGALGDVGLRHESLRTVFAEDEHGPHQILLPATPSAEIVRIGETELGAQIAEAVSYAFDLATEAPLRAKLFDLGAGEHVLLIVLHHIADDGGSMAPLARDLAEAYAAREQGREPEWAPLAVHYADYALWQHKMLGSADDPASEISRQARYWESTLDGLPEQLELPADRPRPAVSSYHGDTITFAIPAAVHEGLVRLARDQHATVFMVVQAALVTLLNRLGAGEDVVIGSPVANRTDEALAELVGFFANSLVLRTDLTGDPSFTEVVDRVRKADLAAYAHQDVPFERVVEALNPARSTARHPLFQTILTWNDADQQAVVDTIAGIPGVSVHVMEVISPIAKFDLSFFFSELREGGLAGALEFATDLFDRDTAVRIADRFGDLLAAVVAEPGRRIGELDLVGPAERHQLLTEWNATAYEMPSGTLTSLIEAQAARTPDAPAVVFGKTTLSYSDLDTRSNRLARHLIDLGARPDTYVAVLLPTSEDVLVTLLAVLKSGAAYLPLDTGHPADRLGFMLADVAPVAVVTTADRAGDVAGTPVVLPDDPAIGARSGAVITGVPLLPAHAAFVIFTSGSTGKPKAVVVEHRSLVAYLAWAVDEYKSLCGRVLVHSPIAFDLTATGLYGPLISGGCVELVGWDETGPRTELAARPDFVKATPSHLQLLGVVADEFSPAGQLVLGGESLLGDALQVWRTAHPGATVLNEYGPTETTVGCTVFRIEPGDTLPSGVITIGTPVWNTRIYVLDALLRPAPIGTSGELYVAGDLVTRGYHGRPGLTAGRFVANPFGDSERMYRTGDLARWTSAGLLEFVSRVDDQVKIRGFRVELGEVEAVLAAVPGIARAAVVVREDQPGDKRLVAYVVPEPDIAADPGNLRAVAAKALPDYMVPSAFLALDVLPLTVNGKLDRRALPAPDYSSPEESRAATDGVEHRVAEIFADVLGIAGIGADDNFFLLGGHSMLVTRLVNRVRTEFGAELSIRDVFDAPTVAGITALVGGGQDTRPPLIAGPRPERLPLSAAQRRMWFLDRLEGPSATYTIPISLRLSGALDVDALRAAFGDLVSRHESLRTLIAEDSLGVHQVVLAEAVPEFTVASCAPSEVDGLVEQASDRPFALETELPVRATLFRTGEREHVLLVVVHHIAGDGTSMRPLADDLADAYTARLAGAAPDWAPLPVQYADYALWQQELPEGQVEFWTEALAGIPDRIELPTDRPRPATMSYRGDTLGFTVPAELRARIRELGRDTSEFMVLQASLALLLSRLGAGGDVVIGSPVEGRPDAALEDLVGLFVNTLALRADVSGNPTFTQLLARVRRHDVAAYAHADVPFEQLVEVLNPVRSRSRHPLFQVMLTMNTESTPPALPGLAVTVDEVRSGLAKFDLSLAFSENGGGWETTIEYATDLFDRSTIAAFAERFLRVLDEVTADPAQRIHDVALLTAAERSEILTARNNTARELASELVPELFEAQAARTPDATAVVSAGETLTYAELDRRANQLARHLVSLGAGPETVVAVVLPRTTEVVVAVLAVLKAGAAYLPIDDSYPAERIAYLMADAGALLKIDGSTFTAELDTYAGDALGVPIDPRGAAYLIYTSGSTGRPKGVVIEHASFAAYLSEAAEMYPAATGESLVHSSLAFDMPVTVLFTPLVRGGRVRLGGLGEHTPRPDLLKITPSHLGLLESLPHTVSDAANLVIGGEALDGEVLQRWRDQHPRAVVVNEYGPTEATVGCVVFRLEPGDELAAGPVPIGRPIGNARVYVLDEFLQPVPDGVWGELYLAGAGLARGYFHRPGQTAERFLADPFGEPGTRMYRVGDRARWGSDGRLRFAGRVDDQVKIRGYRIEPGEIESALTALDEVANAAVVVREDRPGDRRLVAYVVAAGDTVPIDDVRASLAASLPAHLVPSAFVELAVIPLNPNGKLDRRALPAPGAAVSAGGREPQTQAERDLCGLFAEVLGIEKVFPEDDFFALGGHSLLATRLVNRIRTTLGVQVELRGLFDTPTVAGLAATLELGGRHEPFAAQDRPDRLPLSFGQERLWFLYTLDGPSDTYNVPVALRLSGQVDSSALRAALGDVAERHETLRTVFETDARGTQQIILPIDHARPELTVLRSTKDTMAAALAKAAGHRFELGSEIPFRGWLFHLGDVESVLVLVVHHIASDAVSMAPLANDLGEAYRARLAGHAPGWAPLAVQYADYALWQRRVLGSDQDTGSEISRQVRHWTETLSGAPEQIALATDRPRPAVATHHGDTVGFDLPADVHHALTELARAHGATLFMVLHTAFAILLARHGAGTDIVIGTPVAGRADEAVHDLVGSFVNTLVLRVDVGGEPTFSALLARAREADLDAYANQDVPFERLVEALNPERSTAQQPLVQVTIMLNNTGAPATLELPRVVVEPEAVSSAVAKFDLSLSFSERADGGLDGNLEFATDLFDRATVTGLTARLTRILTAATAHPDGLVSGIDLLSDVDRHRVLETWNGTPRVTPTQTVTDLFRLQVLTTPDAVAVVEAGVRTTYAELDARSDGLARHLRTLGVGRETAVALRLERSADLVVATLAVLKTGGAYVPLDSRYPASRLRKILDDTGATVVLTHDRPAPGELVHDLPVVDVGTVPSEVDGLPFAGIHPDQLAYVMYTSGSTGTPKGIAVTHRDIVSLARDGVWGNGAHERVLLRSPHAFDASTYELWAPLLGGGSVVVAPPGELDIAVLRQLLVREDVTGMFLTTALFNVIAEEDPQAFATVREVWTGGELVSPSAFRRVTEACEATSVVHVYGPTEMTTFATFFRVPKPFSPKGTVPIGRAMSGMRAYVLDTSLAPVPPGVPGELYLAGLGMARGYLGLPGATGERFVADPFGTPGTRMYRTGDVVRHTADGQLEFTGRADAQVKIRGFRIEPGEIEAVLTRQESVRQAAVVVREDGAGERYLLAYAVPAPGHRLERAVLRELLTASVPGYMVPSGIVVLDRLPLTPNGKLDHRALPEPEQAAPAPGRGPRSPREEILCRLFVEVLGVPSVSIDDNFFELGGHSLRVTRLVSRVRSVLGVELPVRDVFEAPTPAGIAGRLDLAGAARTGIEVTVRPERIPLSFAQKRLWFLHRFEGPSATYNIPLALRVRGRLDTDALTAALGDVVLRHEALRTVFAEDGDGSYQVVLPAETTEPELTVTGVSAGELGTRLASATSYAFDLTAEIPVRAWVFRLSEVDSVLMLLVHHIAGDAESMGPLAHDLSTAYQARLFGHSPKWAPLEIQYADYAVWQEQVLGDAHDEDSISGKQLAYWRAALAGAPEELDLPTDRPRPASPTGTGAAVPLEISPEAHQRMAELAERAGATVFMVLQTALAALLTNLGAGTDLPIGTPTAGRTDEALDGLVGFFLNTLVLRTDTAGDPSFTELLGRVRRTDLDAYAHQETPFERLVETLNPARSPARHPLFQVMLSFRNNTETVLSLPGLTIEPVEAGLPAAKFDLSFSLTEGFDDHGSPDGVRGEIQYATALFDENTVTGLAERLVRLLDQASREPSLRIGELDVLLPGERDLLLTGWNDTAIERQTTTLAVLFERSVLANADGVAVVADGAELTYRELNDRANRLAHLLIADGAGPESVVALVLPRSLDLIVAAHAVAKAGAAYTPLDVDNPPERNALICAEAGATLAITSLKNTGSVPPQLSSIALDDPWVTERLATRPHTDPTDADRTAALRPGHPAYVMFTSGSTGRPKGVVVSQASVVNHLGWLQRQYRLTTEDRVLQKTPIGFTVSVWELFWPLQTGATTVVAAQDGHRDVEYLTDMFVRHGITTVHFVPSMLEELLAGSRRADLAGLRRIMVGGEGLSRDLHDRFTAAFGVPLHYKYGSTEVTCDATVWDPATEPGTRALVSIGKPIDNTRVYVLDETLRPVAPGVAGELYVSGAQVARGYVRRPGLTAERFVADPYAPSERMYRTGDLAKWDHDGNLYFVGRSDHQLKVRGVRVEPGEIEAVLTDLPSVSRAVVVLRDDVLVAYVTGDGEPAELRRQLAARLPGHLVPGTVVVLPELPTTSSGKLDRAALPAPQRTVLASRAPRTGDERVLCGLFAEILGLPAIGVDDDFFALGGHSLLATRLVTRIRAELGGSVSVRTLFAAPTVAALADRLEAGDETGSMAVLLPLRTGGSGIPLFCMHPLGGLSWIYSVLGRHLDDRYPIYGLQAAGLDGDGVLPGDIGEMAAHYVSRVREVQPSGPYHLLGWSFGGLVTQEMAVQLQAAGEEVEVLLLLDTYPRDPGGVEPSEEELLAGVAVPEAFASFTTGQLDAVKAVFVNNSRIAGAHVPRTFRGDLVFCAANLLADNESRRSPELWSPFVTGRVDEHGVDATHDGMLADRPASVIGRLLADVLRDKERNPS